MEHREILFRGLTTGINKDWIYGSLIEREAVSLIGYYIVTPGTMRDPGGDTIWHEQAVVKRSVGQFIGMKDINGKFIFTGDIIIPNSQFGIGWVSYDAPSFGIENKGGMCNDWDNEDWKEFEVLGNIYQNTGLLK